MSSSNEEHVFLEPDHAKRSPADSTKVDPSAAQGLQTNEYLPNA